MYMYMYIYRCRYRHAFLGVVRPCRGQRTSRAQSEPDCAHKARRFLNPFSKTQRKKSYKNSSVCSGEFEVIQLF